MSMARGSRLAQLELDCMKVLWKQPGATVAQVRSALDRPLAYTTVMTVLDRMSSKGVVTRRKNGRAWLYSPELDREAARLEAINRLLANLFDDNRTELLEYLSRRRIIRPPSPDRSAGVPPALVRTPRPGVQSRAARPRRPARPRSPAPSVIDEFLL